MALGRTLRLAAVVIAIGALATTAQAASHTVTVQNFAFGPPALTINLGDSVTWTNSDAIGHTATSNAGSPATFDKQLPASGGSATVAFSIAGTYAYHCTIHPFMTGTIVVLGPTPVPSTPRPTAPPTAPPTVPPTAPPTAPPTESPTPSPSPSPSPSASPSPTPSPAATPTGTPITLPTGVALASPSPAAGTGPDLGSGPGPVLAAGALALVLVLGGAAVYLYRRR